MKKYVFKNTDDYFSKLTTDLGLLKTVGKINANNYPLRKNQGSGYFERLKFGDGIEIVIGDFKLKNQIQYEYKLKFKNGIELIYFCKGFSRFRDYSLAGPVKINENEIHYWNGGINNEGWMQYPENKEISFVNIFFNEKFVQDILYDAEEELRKTLFSNNGSCFTKKIELSRLIVPFKQIIQSSRKFSSPSELLYLKSKAVEIISYFIDDQFFSVSSEKRQINKKDDIQKIKKARKIIESNLINPFSINELSKKVGLNNYKLKVGFNEVYNTTPFSCLRSLRMEKAKDILIQEKETNIMEIANRVGYSNSSHFAVAFKKEYGINPSVFRKRFSFQYKN